MNPKNPIASFRRFLYGIPFPSGKVWLAWDKALYALERRLYG